jgi:uncharacterized membrane protein YkoI
MPSRRTIIVTAGAVAGVALAGFGIGVALDDPDQEVSSVNLTDARSQPTTDSGPGTTRQVPALEQVDGVVERDGDDLEVGRVDLDFGPEHWVATARPMEDYDGDGNVEDLRAELDGLVGNEARFSVRLDDDGDDADVYAINDLTYREVGGPAPWQPADAVPEEEVRAAAAAAVGEGARVVDLDAEDGSTVAWEAEVVDSQGRDHDVLLDASGQVIDVRRDD